MHSVCKALPEADFHRSGKEIALLSGLHPVVWGVTGLRTDGYGNGHSDCDTEGPGITLALRVSSEPGRGGGQWAHPPPVLGMGPICGMDAESKRQLDSGEALAETPRLLRPGTYRCRGCSYEGVVTEPRRADQMRCPKCRKLDPEYVGTA